MKKPRATIKMSDRLDEYLAMWAEAGERPYEVFRPEELNEFVGIISSRGVDDTVYRATSRRVQPGDVVDYSDRPTSWSFSEYIVRLFIEESPESTVLVLDGHLPGVANHANRYGEEEFVMSPVRLLVEEVQGDRAYVRVL